MLINCYKVQSGEKLEGEALNALYNVGLSDPRAGAEAEGGCAVEGSCGLPSEQLESISVTPAFKICPREIILQLTA